jgi:hypothetical protein
MTLTAGQLGVTSVSRSLDPTGPSVIAVSLETS